MHKDEKDFDMALASTLRAAAMRHASDAHGAPFAVTRADLRKKVRERPRTALIVFVVDASDSMGAGPRMAAAKGAIIALLASAYQRRNRVALIVFRDECAETLLQPTTSVAIARERLRRLPTGGTTPFADGLLMAWQLVKAERAKDPSIEPLLVVLSDGEANVPLGIGADAMKELHALARRVRQDNVHAVAIDTESPLARSDKMRLFAESLGAAYHHVDGLKARHVVDAVRSAGERSQP